MPLLLSFSSMPALPRTVVQPAYDCASLPVGIVHLGIGSFHRAHQAVYTDDALALAGGPWSISGVSLRSPDVRERLGAQDGLYTVVEKSRSGISYRVIGSVRELLFRGDQLTDIVERIAAPATRIVSLTITEKGYCHDPATGELKLEHPQIAHDLREPDDPVSAIGLLVRGLARRRDEGTGSLTVLCCDNLPHNGRMLARLVATFAGEREPALAAWIEANITFPSTMVDRIVPATTEADLAEVRAALGVLDAAPVICEPYKQWVIEDRFASGRPAWHRVGVELVADVEPFEAMKLRLLNGSHSTFAYLGFLAGHQFIYQVAAQPDFIALMRRLMADEVAPTLKLPPGVDVAAYQSTLIERFANPVLPHRTQQIAMDGSQKLPQRLLGTIRDNLAAERPINLLSLAIAGWMRYVSGTDEAGRVIDIDDPLAGEFAAIAAAHRADPTGLARALLGIHAIFGDDLPADPRFTGKVTAWLASLYADGAARTVARAVRGS